MPSKRRRNPNGLTTDEILTGARLVDEGYPRCEIIKEKYRMRRPPYTERVYTYPRLVVAVNMCDREALEPVSRVFSTKIVRGKTKKVACPAHLFPPDGKGRWVVKTHGRKAETIIERLKPALTKEFIRKYELAKHKCANNRTKKPPRHL